MALSFLLIGGLALLPSVLSQSGAWGQCGGIGWTGATTCVSGYVCTASGAYYSQCIPGTAAPTTTTVSGTATSSSAVPSGSGGLGSPSPTLLPNYYWIRAVEAPNFHYYLQSSPPQQTGLAVLASYTTAGQFNIVDGKLVQVLSDGTLLYGIVETPTSTSVKLSLTWSKSSANTVGTFSWSGDGLAWTIPTVSRPNNIAWLVCEDQHAYINLGPYAYNTPAGCVDETIHYYNGATAVS